MRYTSFFCGGGGELVNSFPPHVTVQVAKTTSLGQLLRKRRLISLLKNAYYRFKIRTAKAIEDEGFWTAKTIVPPDIQADAVICFTNYNFACLYLTAWSNAPKKAMWVHGEFRQNANLRRYEDVLGKFQRVFCVSESRKQEFNDKIPSFRHLTQTIYNLIDVEGIRRDAQQECPVSMPHVSLLTVGRLSVEKGQQMIPAVLTRLLQNHYDVTWYLAGDGPLKDELCEKAEQLGIDDRLVFIGTVENPFPYMKQCDIYVQPSLSEGYCTTTNEARILCKPVVATDIPSMREQFTDGETGLLVEPTEDALYEGVKKLLDSEKLRNKFSENLKSLKIDNEKELQKLYEFIDS